MNPDDYEIDSSSYYHDFFGEPNYKIKLQEIDINQLPENVFEDLIIEVLENLNKALRKE